MEIHNWNIDLVWLRPSDAYMRQQSRPSLVQIMACRWVGTKPLSKPMSVNVGILLTGPLSLLHWAQGWGEYQIYEYEYNMYKYEYL